MSEPPVPFRVPLTISELSRPWSQVTEARELERLLVHMSQVTAGELMVETLQYATGASESRAADVIPLAVSPGSCRPR